MTMIVDLRIERLWVNLNDIIVSQESRKDYYKVKNN